MAGNQTPSAPEHQQFYPWDSVARFLFSKKKNGPPAHVEPAGRPVDCLGLTNEVVTLNVASTATPGSSQRPFLTDLRLLTGGPLSQPRHAARAHEPAHLQTAHGDAGSRHTAFCSDNKLRSRLRETGNTKAVRGPRRGTRPEGQKRSRLTRDGRRQRTRIEKK